MRLIINKLLILVLLQIKVYAVYVYSQPSMYIAVGQLNASNQTQLEIVNTNINNLTKLYKTKIVEEVKLRLKLHEQNLKRDVTIETLLKEINKISKDDIDME